MESWRSKRESDEKQKSCNSVSKTPTRLISCFAQKNFAL